MHLGKENVYSDVGGYNVLRMSFRFNCYIVLSPLFSY